MVGGREGEGCGGEIVPLLFSRFNSSITSCSLRSDALALGLSRAPLILGALNDATETGRGLGEAGVSGTGGATGIEARGLLALYVLCMLGERIDSMSGELCACCIDETGLV